MDIPEDDFYRAINIANKTGLEGREVSIRYFPSTCASDNGGTFIVNSWTRSASGQIEDYR